MDPGSPETGHHRLHQDTLGLCRQTTVLKDRVRELRLIFRPPDPCHRTHHESGELAQFDLWQPDIEVPLGWGQTDKLWVVTAVSGFSRFDAAWMVPDPSRP